MRQNAIVLYSQISFPSSAFFTFLRNKQKKGIWQKQSGSEKIANLNTIPHPLKKWRRLWTAPNDDDDNSEDDDNDDMAIMMTIARMMTMLSWQWWWTLTHGVTATTPPWQVGSPRADTDTRTGGCCVLLVHVIAIRTTINMIIVSKAKRFTAEYEEEEEHWAGMGGEWCSEASKGLKRGRKRWGKEGKQDICSEMRCLLLSS